MVFYRILEPLSSVNFGRRTKCPAGFRMAASEYAKEQWSHMRQLAQVALPSVVEDIDRRPQWEPPIPTLKKDWNNSISAMKRKVTLTEPEESALFRAPQFPSSLLHVEADLRGKKPFKDALLRTNVAGACGLALVRYGELAFSSLRKEYSIMSRLHDAISGDSPQDAESLLQVIRRRSTSRRMRPRASSWCQIGISILECFSGSCLCGVHPRSTSSRHVSQRRRPNLCHGGLRTHWKPSTLSP
jgi:hypothetical protein